MVSKCPTTEKSWDSKSAAKGCSPKENYHCVQTQDGEVIELCTNAIWIETGSCPVYSRAGILESKLCQPRVLQTACPPKMYKSNQVFKYTACFPENSISTTSTQKSIPIGKQTIILNTTTIPTADDAGTGLELLALLILIPFMLGFLVVLYLQRRGYIKLHRLCTNGRERSGESSELKSSADKGHCSIDIGENKEESEKFLPDDTGKTTDEQCNTTMNPKVPLLPGYSSIDHFGNRNDFKEREVHRNEDPVEKNTENHASNIKGQPSSAINFSSNVRKIKSKDTGTHLDTSIEPNLSIVSRMSDVLSSKVMLIITGLPGSGKTTLALKITEAACRRFTEGVNLRYIMDLEELDEMMSDKETFLILDDCIKSWFNEIYLNIVFKKISGVLQNKGNSIHVLLCAPPEIWNKSEKLLLSSALQYEVLNLTDVTSYIESDWDKIFNWHMQRNIELKRYENQVEMNVRKWMKDYRKHKAKEIGKPAIAYFLCRSVKTLENSTSLFKDPRKFLESSISGLLNTGPSNQNPFVLLVYLMLHNGKAKSDQMKSKIIKDICSAYKIQLKHLGSLNEVKYDEIEVKQNEVSVRSKDVVRATFDFVWKDHKDLIIRYCDDDLFLEHITLKGCKKHEIIKIATRFTSMINAGKSNVEHHYILEDPCLKHRETVKKSL